MCMEKIHEELNKNYKDYGYNCAETTVRSFNAAKDLQIPELTFKVFGGFGGGMFTGGVCGAVSGGIAILSYLYVTDSGHRSPELKARVILFSKLVEERLGGLDCRDLKPKYSTEEEGCLPTIRLIAEIVEEVCLAKVDF